MINQLLAKGLPLKRILESFLITHPGESIRLDYNPQSLMIEIGHNNLESLILLPNQILHRNFDILKVDIRSPTGPHALTIHPSNTHSRHSLLNQQKTHSIRSRTPRTDSNSEIIRPNSIGDPFLFSIDDIMFSVFGFLGFTHEIGDVGTCIGFSDT